MKSYTHLNLTEVGRSGGYVVLNGSLNNCKQMAAACGLDVTGEQGRLLGFDGQTAFYDTVTVTTYHLTHGFIMRARDGWDLLLPVALLEEAKS